jgi:hypothetical protein
MSKPKLSTVTCSCGSIFQAEVFRSANVTLEPDVKDRILTGQFNRVTCPTCARQVDADVPFLYHDMQAEIMVWVYPVARSGQASAIREKVRRSYEIVGSVLPREEPSAGRDVVFGIEELISLLDRSEE